MDSEGQHSEYPAGWYGDEHDIRWWDGQQWTEHVGVPIPPKWAWWRVSRRQWVRRIGWSLVAPLIGSPWILGVMSMGDYFPIRTGLQRNGDLLQAVNPVCPQERLLRVELVREMPGDDVVIWELVGNVPLPRTFDLGQPIEGMREVRPLRNPLTTPQQPDPKLWLYVTTDLTNSYSTLGFHPSEVPVDGIFRASSVYSSEREFDRAAFDDTPCDDPHHDREKTRFLLLGAAGIVVLAVPGLVLLFLTRRRRPR